MVAVAVAAISLASTPSLGITISAENSLEPSGVIRLIMWTASTLPSTVVIRAGMETSTFWPAFSSPA